MSKKYPKITNHWTNKPLGRKVNKAVHEAREARLDARRLARSGHPGRAAQGRQMVAEISEQIRGLYVQDWREQA